MMKIERLSAARLAQLLLVLTLVAVGPAAAVGASPPQERELAEGELWSAGVASIESGRFDEARDLIGKILTTAPDKDNYLEIAQWLDQRNEMQNTRLELQRAVRQQHIERAKKNMDKEEWGDALYYIRRAVESSSEPADFMRDPWVQAIHDKAVEQANKHREEGKWAEASGIYYELKSLFEGNPQYEQLMEECLSHSRIEAGYDPEDAEEGWKHRLQGITEKMIEDALWRIQNSYVEEVDFRKVVEGGLRRLLLLAESEALKKQFPSLADSDNNRQYVTRIDRRLQVLSREEAVSWHQATRHFDVALKINRQSVDLPPELVIHEFTEGALEKLDKFTSMIWPSDFADFEKHTQGHFTGVGIQIGLDENSNLTVISPLEDTPAYHAGIQAEDKLTHIDGQSTKGLSLNGAVRKITGPPGTEVVLTILRPDEARTFDVTLRRTDIQIRTVKGFHRAEGSKWDYMIDPEFGIAYVRLTNFSETTTAELREALDQIKQARAKALILDLRFNPGGLLRSAIEVSELFVPDKKLIVRTEGRDSQPYSREAENHGEYLELPMIVLVNEQSASASEIVSGALKDHHRALIVGERTFGKGSVQNLIPMGNSVAHLKLTTAYYYLPGGRCIHKAPGAEVWGVEPDIEVKLFPREQAKVFSMRRDADVIRAPGAKAGANGKPVAKADPPANDDQPGAKPDQAEGGVASESGGKTESDSERPSKSAVAAAAESEEGSDALADEDAADEEDEEEEDAIELPDVDYQLETAKLVLRVQLLKDFGFQILPKHAANQPVGPRI